MSVYFENLCVFNGQAKAGYTIIAQQKTAVIHPSSVLRSLGSHPKWLIYGDLRRTNQDFMCDLTPFEAEWMNEVIPKSFLDKIDIENLERIVMKEEKMENVGKYKTEMEKGMEWWSEKVLNVQVESIKKAEDKVQQGKLEMKQTI